MIEYHEAKLADFHLHYSKKFANYFAVYSMKNNFEDMIYPKLKKIKKTYEIVHKSA